MLNGSSPTADPVNGMDSSSHNTGDVIKRKVSCVLSSAVSFVKKPFARAPATTHIPAPRENDDVDLERGQDAPGPETHRGTPNRSASYTWEDFGLQIVKFWVLPTSMAIALNALGTAVNLYQVFKTNESVEASTPTFMLKPYFASGIFNVVCGMILLPLSTKVNFPGKTFLLKVFVILTSASAFLGIVFMSAVGWQIMSLI